MPGIFDAIRSAFTRSPAVLAPELPPAPTPTSEERTAAAFLERAFAGASGEGSQAMTLLGAREHDRRGNNAVLRSYATSPWQRATAGRIATSVASLCWRLYAQPLPMAEQPSAARMFLRRMHMRHVRIRRGTARMSMRSVRWDQLMRAGVRLDDAPHELRDMPQGHRADLVRSMLAGGELIEITRHPWHRLMAQPNAMQTGRVARQVTTLSTDLVGDSAWVLGGPAGGLPTHAWPIPGTWIKTRPTPDAPWWEVQLGAGGATQATTTWKVPIDALLLFTDPDPANSYGRGVGIGYTLGDEGDIDEAAAKMLAAFFHNGALPAALVSIKGARKEVLERTKREWNAALQGFKRAFKTHFTGGEIDVKRVDTPFKDMALPEVRKHQRDVFQQVYGMPPEKMGNMESSSWASSSAADLIMAQEVIVPRAELQREQFQRLAWMFDARLVADYDDPVPDNVENKRALIQAAPSYFRVDEVRAAANEDPTGDIGGRGFMVNGVWYADLSRVGPVIEAHHIAAGIPSVNEARRALRLPDTTDDGDKPTPRSLPVPALGYMPHPDDAREDEDEVDAPAPTPEPAAPTQAQGPKPADTALNGAQIASLVDLCSQVSAGTLPKASAKAIMLASFPGLDENEINAILDPIVEGGSAPEPPAAEPAPVFTNAARVLRLWRRLHALSAGDALIVQREARGLAAAFRLVDVDGFGPDNAPAPAAVIEGVLVSRAALTSTQTAAVLRAIDVDSMLDALEPTVAALVKEWGQETIDAIDVDGAPAFDDDAARVRAHMRELAARVRLVNETTRAALAGALATVAADADGENARAPKDLVSLLEAAIELVFDTGRESRAPSIATTEATTHAGFATNEGLNQLAGIVTILKEWISTLDDRVRDSHETMDGQRQPPDDDFQLVSGENRGARAPHPGAFGIPGEDINCRCAVGSVVLDDDEKAARIIIGRSVLPASASREERAAAWRTHDAQLKSWESKLARAVRDGFDRQQVRALSALHDALG